jgi:hypothetical protein
MLTVGVVEVIMFYQSTGEVRDPKIGDMFLSFPPSSRSRPRRLNTIIDEMQEAAYTGFPRVIMKPMRSDNVVEWPVYEVPNEVGD